MYKIIALIFFFNTASRDYTFFKNDPIDVVIPCHEKDLNKLEHCIRGIKRNCIGIGKVFVISKNKLTNNAIWINEEIWPFNKLSVALEIFDNLESAHKFANSTRVGWILKQLLVLYAPITINGVSSNVLVLDADTIFLNPVKFIDVNTGGPLFNTGTEYYKPYFDHAKKIIKGDHQIQKIFQNYSGITHHMLFQKDIILDLFSQIEATHNVPAWKALCKCIDLNEVDSGCMSEFEIYFNFAFQNCKESRIRKLKWKNTRFKVDKIKEYKEKGFHYISCHDYIHS